MADRALCPDQRGSSPASAAIRRPTSSICRRSCGSSITGAGWSSARSPRPCRGNPPDLADRPIYRAWVTLEANPPTFCGQRRTVARSSDVGEHTYDFVATQVGLFGAGASPSGRPRNSISPIMRISFRRTSMRRSACGRPRRRSSRGLKVDGARTGRTDQVQLSIRHRRSLPRWSRTQSPTASSTRRFSGATNPRPTRAISSSGRSTRPGATSSGRNGGSSLMRSNRASSRLGRGGRPAIGRRHQFAAGRIAGQAEQALAEATARALPPKAHTAKRWRLDRRPKSTRARSRCSRNSPSCSRLSAEAHIHEAGSSRDGQPSVADRRASEADRAAKAQGVRAEQRSSRGLSGSSFRGAGAPGPGRATEGRGAEPSRPEHPIYDPAARGGHQPRLYDALLQRYKQIGVAGGVGIAPVSIVDRAEVPTLPVQAEPAPEPVGRPRAWPVRRRRRRNRARICQRHDQESRGCPQETGAAVPRGGPRTPARESFVDDLRNPTSVISEAYSAIVAALRFSTEEGMPKVLLLTSTAPAKASPRRPCDRAELRAPRKVACC